MSNFTYKDLVGAVYDVDDTLLDNSPNDGHPIKNLHERSRLAAMHAIGNELGYTKLLQVTPEENLKAFQEAPTHTMDSATWLILHRYGVVKQADLIPNHPVLVAIIERKAALHMELLLAAGTEIPGASAFVLGLEQNGLQGKQAVASGARLEEIQVFLHKYALSGVFPRHRIFARGDYAFPKPHRDPFDKAFKALGLPDTPEMRARTLAVEDDPKGYISAHQAGLYTCVLTNCFAASSFIIDGHKPQRTAANMTELGKQLGLPMV